MKIVADFQFFIFFWGGLMLFKNFYIKLPKNDPLLLFLNLKIHKFTNKSNEEVFAETAFY